MEIESNLTRNTSLTNDSNDENTIECYKSNSYDYKEQNKLELLLSLHSLLSFFLSHYYFFPYHYPKFLEFKQLHK